MAPAPTGAVSVLANREHGTVRKARRWTVARVQGMTDDMGRVGLRRCSRACVQAGQKWEVDYVSNSQPVPA